MGFQDLVGSRLRCRYKKLNNADEKVARPRSCWVQKGNGRGLKGLRLSRSRKIILKAFSVMVSPIRIARIYGDIANRVNDGVCPAIIFPTQWGLPVVSHLSASRKSVISFNKNLTYIR